MPITKAKRKQDEDRITVRLREITPLVRRAASRDGRTISDWVYRQLKRAVEVRANGT